VPNSATVPSTTVPSSLSVPLKEGAWNAPPLITRVELPIKVGEGSVWNEVSRICDSGDGVCAELNLQKSRKILEELKWLTSKLTIPKPLQSWNKLSFSGDPSGPENQQCAPRVPPIQWVPVEKIVGKGSKMTISKKVTYTPMEDVVLASDYERKVKRRPGGFKVQLATDLATNKGIIDIASNPVSLASRARRLLVQNEDQYDCPNDTNDPWQFDFRIVEHDDNDSDENQLSFNAMTLTSNKNDPSAEQPPNFKKFPLRKEQLRSLHWMLAQENDKEAAPFYEEEVAESVLPSVGGVGSGGWRAEARVCRPKQCLGGIVADQVGYGKTAITLGLIDSAPKVNGKAPLPSPRVQRTTLATKATLVIIPQHLGGQWPKEVKKFCGNSKRVVELRTFLDFNKVTAEDIQKADIVIVNFTVMQSDKYSERLMRLGGCDKGGLPNSKKVREEINQINQIKEKSQP